MTPRRKSLRQETQKRCEIATKFVNAHSSGTAPGNKLDRFMDKHWDSLKTRFDGDRLVAREFLRHLGSILRDAWDTGKWDTAEENLESVFAAPDKRKLSDELHSMKPGEGRMGPVTSISAMKLFRRPAFKIHLGKRLPKNKPPLPTFEPRDVLDEIAYAILRASSLGLLKTCEGKRRGWGCIQPYLVADEGRRRFCYALCGELAKQEAPSKKGRKEKQ
jgi:hypothetical protein